MIRFSTSRKSACSTPIRRGQHTSRGSVEGAPENRPDLQDCFLMSCCDPRGCDRFFTPRLAGRVARRYRRKGLDKTAREMVAFLEAAGIEGVTVLEIGGGVGEIQIELLKQGAERTVNLELSPSYEDEAVRLLREAGVEERAERRLHDIAADPEAVERMGVVVLHRVVCCYPDYERLLAASAEHAQRLIVFSYPRYHVLTRFFAAAQNLLFRMLRREFRVFAHPPSKMLTVLRQRGFRLTFTHQALIWQVAGLERSHG